MEVDWDLHAVVRSCCSTAATKTTAGVQKLSSSPQSLPISPLSVIGGLQDPPFQQQENKQVVVQGKQQQQQAFGISRCTSSNAQSTRPKKRISAKTNTESMIAEEMTMSLLDLPNLALECILERLEPDGLFRMACVSGYLMDMCLSDHLWDWHMKKKWGRIFGPAAYKEWHLYIASKKEPTNYFLGGEKRGTVMRYLSKLWPVKVRSGSVSFDDHDDSNKMISIASQPSIVSCYRVLETGKFCFPAQVFNRENGHVGFMLSCYDADLTYDLQTDTFKARYPPHGRRAAAIETGVSWDRVRAPPVDTSPHDLHISDCLNDLRPRYHIEIQWRRNKQFPYGWWYGVVGHLEACDGNENYCHCRESGYSERRISSLGT